MLSGANEISEVETSKIDFSTSLKMTQERLRALTYGCFMRKPQKNRRYACIQLSSEGLSRNCNRRALSSVRM